MIARYFLLWQSFLFAEFRPTVLEPYLIEKMIWLNNLSYIHSIRYFLYTILFIRKMYRWTLMEITVSNSNREHRKRIAIKELFIDLKS